MIEYFVFRQDFQADNWIQEGRVQAEDAERAVRVCMGQRQDALGTFVAIPADDYMALFDRQDLVVVMAKVEVYPQVDLYAGRS